MCHDKQKLLFSQFLFVTKHDIKFTLFPKALCICVVFKTHIRINIQKQYIQEVEAFVKARERTSDLKWLGGRQLARRLLWS